MRDDGGSDTAERIAGFVLAGGASARFGQDKALAKIAGCSMLERMCDLLGGVAGTVRVVAPPGRYERGTSAAIVEDRWPGEGPLGGIITALRTAEQDLASGGWSLILSCDMPFLTREWLAYMSERALRSDAEVVVPRSAHGLEPLCACWNTGATAKLEAAFAEDVRKVTEGMKRLETEVLDESHWKAFDGEKRLFWNMNTPEDYVRARAILEAEEQ